METRGVWITNTDSEVLRNKQSIAEAMDFLTQTGFNVVFPVIWNKAVTLYPSQVMWKSFGIEIDPQYVGRDPLAELISEAHSFGINALPCEGGYDEGTIERYRKAFNRNPPQNPKDRQWLQWRADILTDFLARLYHEVKAINPDMMVSMAPSIYDWSLKEYLQDSQAWLRRGLVDLIHPQIYSRNFESYRRIVDRLVTEHSGEAWLVPHQP